MIEPTLQIYTYNPAANWWIEQPTTQDTANNTITTTATSATPILLAAGGIDP